MNELPKIPRRIITGIKNGRSTITSDANVTNVSEHIPGLVISDIWATDTMPVDLEKEVHIENTLFPNTPERGTYFRYVQIPPDTHLNNSDVFLKPQPNQPHPMMHKTKTLDYIIIISGELYLILDDTETLLKPGDIVIQRATNHAWSNRSRQPCIQLAILIDAKD